MSTTIRAAVSRRFGEPMTIEDVVLRDPGPDEVRVEIDACAICHSDLLYLEGAWGGDLPAVWGHEAAGRIAACGAAVSDLRVGDPVVVTLIRHCGACANCARGFEVACTASFPLDTESPLQAPTGESITHGLGTAAFAEQVVVHRSQAIPIDSSVPAASASLLACGVLTGAGAVTNTAQVPAGASVAVIGIGGVGIHSVQAARLAGADPIIAIDVNPDKLELAREVGATHTVNAATEDLAVAIGGHTGGAMVDYVFVTTAAKPALDGGAALVAPTGALVLVGMPATGVTTELDPGTVASLNQRILGSKMGTASPAPDIAALIGHYHADELMLDELVTATYPLDRIDEAIASSRAGHAIRNVIVFERTDLPSDPPTTTKSEPESSP